MWGLNDILTHSIAYGMGEEEEKAKAEREKKASNNWHTGTPTEEGLYLTTVKVDNCYAYEPVHWKNKWGFRHFDKPIVAWQKITPYEEKEK